MEVQAGKPDDDPGLEQNTKAVSLRIIDLPRELWGTMASIHLCHIYSIRTQTSRRRFRVPGPLQALLLLHFCIFYAINCFCPVLNPKDFFLILHRKRSSASRCVTDHMSDRDESGLDSIQIFITQIWWLGSAVVGLATSSHTFPALVCWF